MVFFNLHLFLGEVPRVHNNGFSSGRDGREGKELQGIQRLSSDCSVFCVLFHWWVEGKAKGQRLQDVSRLQASQVYSL